MSEEPHPSVTGPELFARYAYPPNELGYCGPDDPAGLLAGGDPAATIEITRRAQQFEGAWVYLELIAEAAGIADPLDARVVEAYWLGNHLLERIEGEWFLERLRERFRGQTGGQWAGGIPDLVETVRPHHAFHVFAIYPWVGLLGRPGDVARSVLDQCRIKCGEVVTVDGPEAQVAVRALGWDGRLLSIGPPSVMTARWSVDGRSFLGGLEVGDQVAVHWDWVCDVLRPDQVEAVEDFERRQLAVTNEVLSRTVG